MSRPPNARADGFRCWPYTCRLPQRKPLIITSPGVSKRSSRTHAIWIPALNSTKFVYWACFVSAKKCIGNYFARVMGFVSKGNVVRTCWSFIVAQKGKAYSMLDMPPLLLYAKVKSLACCTNTPLQKTTHLFWRNSSWDNSLRKWSWTHVQTRSPSKPISEFVQN